DGLDPQTFSFTGEEAFRVFVGEMTGVDWETGELDSERDSRESDEGSDLEKEEGAKVGDVNSMGIRPSPVEYNLIKSPFTDRWPYAYQVEPILNGENTTGAFANEETYREPKFLAEHFTELPYISPNWIGFYDPSELNISRDPTTELPM